MNGIILLDKPAGITSFGAVSRMRKILNMKKVGHTGTLDPMATGVLPILVGSATRFADYLPSGDKRYTALIKLGFATDTYDTTGEIISQREVNCNFEEIENALMSFKGEINQVPPMYSAVQKDGVRMYELARKGIEVERAPRKITVYSIKILDYDEGENELTVDIKCSKGTYIRSLAYDLGEKLGCGACLSGLRRTMACGFKLDDCYSLEELQEYAENNRLEKRLMPIEDALSFYAPIYVTDAQAKRFKNGGELALDRLKGKNYTDGYYRVFNNSGDFLGLGEADNKNMILKVAKVFVC